MGGILASTGRRSAIEEGPGATLPFLRRHGVRLGWQETRTAKDTPCFVLPAGGTLTFEPGGQLEYSSPACPSPSVLLGLLRGTIVPLRAAAANEGIDLLTVGLDPSNPLECAPLLLHNRRYDRMAEYLASVSQSSNKVKAPRRKAWDPGSIPGWQDAEPIAGCTFCQP